MIKTRAARRKELEGTQDQPQQSADEKPKSDGGPTDILEKGTPVKYPPSEKSRRSSSSSIRAQRHKLELEAAEAKARIQMELIDKKLAADLNNLEYSSRSHTNEEVERWLERSQQLEQPAPEDGLTTGGLCPPATENATTGNAAAGNDYGTVQMLASALKDLAAASTSHSRSANLLSRISTPQDLPMFSGDPMDWLQFRQAYEESTQVCNFSPKENLWCLRKCLRGPAKEAVTALLITATSPVVVMATLELQFGNPEVIINRITYDIKKLHPISFDYHKDIVPFSIKVRNYVAAVRALNRQEYLQDTGIASVIINKLPTILISKWTDYSYGLLAGGAKCKLDILSEFLNQEAV
ncbi:unnamed protein product, partial [Iphiclides podalirius]